MNVDENNNETLKKNKEEGKQDNNISSKSRHQKTSVLTQYICLQRNICNVAYLSLSAFPFYVRYLLEFDVANLIIGTTSVKLRLSNNVYITYTLTILEIYTSARSIPAYYYSLSSFALCFCNKNILG